MDPRNLPPDPEPPEEAIAPAVRLAGVTYRYKEGFTLREISLQVEQGEWVALFGPPGCGKSTILRLLAGELQPESGAVSACSPLFIGQALPPAGRARVAERIMNRLGRLGVPSVRRAGRTTLALELLGMEALRDVPERTLTPVQKVMLELAVAIAAEPAVLLLDDVLVLLPDPIRERFETHMRGRCAADGLAVVHATCSSDQAERSDRVAVLDQGRLLAFEPTAPLLRDHAPDTITVEAADPSSVQRTLRGIFDVTVVETRDGLRFAATDPEDVAAHLLRHPAGGVRVIYARRGSLWEVYRGLVEKQRA